MVGLKILNLYKFLGDSAALGQHFGNNYFIIKASLTQGSSIVPAKNLMNDHIWNLYCCTRKILLKQDFSFSGSVSDS